MSLPSVRTTDTVHSSDKLNKTYTISSACPEFDDITHCHDIGNEKRRNPQEKIIDSKDKTVIEKDDSVTIVNSGITSTEGSKAIPEERIEIRRYGSLRRMQCYGK